MSERRSASPRSPRDERDRRDGDRNRDRGSERDSRGDRESRGGGRDDRDHRDRRYKDSRGLRDHGRDRDGDRDRDFRNRDRGDRGDREYRSDRDRRDRDRDHRDSGRDHGRDREPRDDREPSRTEPLDGQINEEGFVELSVNDMNALRAKLGLPPLKEAPSKPDRAPKQEEVKEEEPQTLEDRLEAVRKKREKMKKNKFLKPIDSDEEPDDALSWVERARKIKQEKELKEMEERRKRLEAEMEAMDGSSDSEDAPVALREKRRQKRGGPARQHATTGHDSAAVTAGMVVAHSASEVAATEGTILTLRDKGILIEDGNDLDLDDVDELESMELAQMEKLKKKSEIKAKTKRYDVYDDKQTDILQQYDDEPEAPKFVLDASGSAITALEEEKKKSIQSKLDEARRKLSTYDVDEEKQQQADFYTKEEMLQFKKKGRGNKAKKRRIRSRPTTLADEIVPLVGDEDHEKHLGSRALREERKREIRIEEIVNDLEKRQKYESAIEKAVEDSKWLFEDDNEEEEELYRSLARFKKLADREKNRNQEDEIAERVTRRMEEEEFSSGGVVFNTNTDFIRNVQTQKEQQDEDNEPVSITLKKRQQAKKKAMLAAQNLIEEKMEVEGIPAESESMETEVELEKDLKIVEELVSEKAVPDRGLAGALEYLKTRGGAQTYNEETTRARTNDRLFAPRDANDDVQLVYKDKDGKVLSTKEAYRLLCYQFHGKAPGKKKVEKRLKREAEELRRKQMSSSDTVPTPLQVLQKVQTETGQAFLVTDGNTQRIIEKHQANLEKPAPKKKKGGQ